MTVAELFNYFETAPATVSIYDARAKGYNYYTLLENSFFNLMEYREIINVFGDCVVDHWECSFAGNELIIEVSHLKEEK